MVSNVSHSIQVRVCRYASRSLASRLSSGRYFGRRRGREIQRWGSSLSGLSQGKLRQGLSTSQCVKQSVHVRMSRSPVQSAVPALHLVVGSDIRVKHIPHSHKELAVKVGNTPLDGDLVCDQRFIAEGGVGWPDSHHRQERQCHHPVDESETTVVV